MSNFCVYAARAVVDTVRDVIPCAVWAVFILAGCAAFVVTLGAAFALSEVVYDAVKLGVGVKP